MNKLHDYLLDLKTNYNAIGLKAEFETEGASFNDVYELKKISQDIGLYLSVKIGGCGDIRSLIDSKEIGADTIVAPMIESPYALQKFVTSCNSIYTKPDKYPKLYINIETICGIENINYIFDSKYMEYIHGIVLGRGDLSESLNTDVNNDKIKNITDKLISITQKYNKKLIIGGKISPDNMLNIPQKQISAIETRKVIFAPPVKREGIIKALEFEIEWLKNKPSQNIIDENRLKELNKRILIMDK